MAHETPVRQPSPPALARLTPSLVSPSMKLTKRQLQHLADDISLLVIGKAETESGRKYSEQEWQQLEESLAPELSALLDRDFPD